MMKQKKTGMLTRYLSALLAALLLVSMLPVGAVAEQVSAEAAQAEAEDDGVMIVVSLGDSYSSGEGIEPFYGQEITDFYEKMNNKDWLAHRSTLSWPAQIEIPGIPGTMADYKADESDSPLCQWYFVAASGATTEHMNQKQNKPVTRIKSLLDGVESYDDKELVPQLDVFEGLTGKVDYVTITIGGNDVGFGDIVKMAVMGSTSLIFKNQALQDALNTALADIDKYLKKLEDSYRDIQKAAGEQAYIIVVGYPTLFDQNGKGLPISKKEATWINDAVRTFNDGIERTVKKCQEEGMRIVFVDVEGAFDGHEAYASEAWLNEVLIFPRDEDLDQLGLTDYSVHPTAEGARAYADCVNTAIAQIEEEKRISGERKVSDISGTITIADADTDMTNNLPLEGAAIQIDFGTFKCETVYSGPDGKYELPNIPAGVYEVMVYKTGYIPVTETLTVTVDDDDVVYNIAIEAISQQHEGRGYAGGVIYDAGNGKAVSGLTLLVRSGLNNTTGVILQSLTSDASGRYLTGSIEAGNYTIEIVDNRTDITSAERYTTAAIPVKVLGDTTISNQNGYVSNGLEAGELRVTLSWGSTPADLDSHMVGPNGSGGRFHEFYRDVNNQSDTDLDVDDTSSYGPETITIYREKDGVYTYAVHDYTNKLSGSSRALSNSGAKVEVYRGNQLLRTFYVPSNQGGTLWTVFSYDSRTQKITMINTMTYESYVDSVLSNWAVD